MNTKRDVWRAMQDHLPELAEQLPEIVRVFGAPSSVQVDVGSQKWEWRQ